MEDNPVTSVVYLSVFNDSIFRTELCIQRVLSGGGLPSLADTP